MERKHGNGYKDIIGLRYNKLVVLSKIETSGNGHARFLCQCDCGKRKDVFGTNLRRGLTTSCGCEQKRIMSEVQQRRILKEELEGGRITFIKGSNDKYSQLRESKEYKKWRKSVLLRDNYTCVECECNEIEMHVHHIKHVVCYPELIFDTDNGITLCVHCHAIKHPWHQPLQNRSQKLKIA